MRETFGTVREFFNWKKKTKKLWAYNGVAYYANTQVESKLIMNNLDKPVVGYTRLMEKDRMLHYVMIFKGRGKYVAFCNGNRLALKTAMKVIEESQFTKSETTQGFKRWMLLNGDTVYK